MHSSILRPMHAYIHTYPFVCLVFLFHFSSCLASLFSTYMHNEALGTRDLVEATSTQAQAQVLDSDVGFSFGLLLGSRFGFGFGL